MFDFNLTAGSISDKYLSEKFGLSVLLIDPPWSDLVLSYDAQGLEDSGIKECLRRSKMLMKVQVNETHARWHAPVPSSRKAMSFRTTRLLPW